MNKHAYFRIFLLALFTIVYNLAEGIISVWVGAEDETLTLMGFGIDSFIEMLSGFGILYMATHLLYQFPADKAKYEKIALNITGFSFYMLGAGLIAGAAAGFYTAHKPESTFWGWIIALISIAVMLWLYLSKISLGRRLQSDAIIADAKCTVVCIYMSLVLLISSLIYEYTGFPYIDAAGALGLAWFSFAEGRESFEKVKLLKGNRL